MSEEIINSTRRLGVLIDVQNLFYSARHQYGAKVDYEKLLKQMTKGRILVRAIAYIVTSEETDQSKFIGFLKNVGYEVKAKNLRSRADGSQKGNWDMGIAIDAITIADKIDILTLVSGDGDYVDLIRLLQAKGVYVEVLSFPKSTAQDLMKCANQYIPISEDILSPLPTDLPVVENSAK